MSEFLLVLAVLSLLSVVGVATFLQQKKQLYQRILDEIPVDGWTESEALILRVWKGLQDFRLPWFTELRLRLSHTNGTSKMREEKNAYIRKVIYGLQSKGLLLLRPETKEEFKRRTGEEGLEGPMALLFHHDMFSMKQLS